MRRNSIHIVTDIKGRVGWAQQCGVWLVGSVLEDLVHSICMGNGQGSSASSDPIIHGTALCSGGCVLYVWRVRDVRRSRETVAPQLKFNYANVALFRRVGPR